MGWPAKSVAFVNVSCCRVGVLALARASSHVFISQGLYPSKELRFLPHSFLFHVLCHVIHLSSPVCLPSRLLSLITALFLFVFVYFSLSSSSILFFVLVFVLSQNSWYGPCISGGSLCGTARTKPRHQFSVHQNSSRFKGRSSLFLRVQRSANLLALVPS